MNYGNLHLIPKDISEESGVESVTPIVYHLIGKIKIWAVENIKTARRYLKKINPDIIIDELDFYELSKRTDYKDNEIILSLLKSGKDVGLMSEAGLPGIADPGNSLIISCHEIGVEVIPHAGPSSMLLALISSGLNGQNFSFSGYLPVNQSERKKVLRKLEKESREKHSSQIFMETPYRNNSVFKSALESLKGNTWFCVACDIDSKDQYIKTYRISYWKNTKKPDLHKRPAVFILQAFDN